MSTAEKNSGTNQNTAYKFSISYFLLLGAVFIFLYFIFKDGILHAVKQWDSPEYSHAYLIPIISLFIIWQRNNEIIKEKMHGSWLGAVIVLAGLFFWLLGEISTLFIIIKYALLVVIFGLVLSFSGVKQIAHIIQFRC